MSNSPAPGAFAPSFSDASLPDAEYLQGQLDATRAELESFKKGLAGEIRAPLIKELIGLAHSLETFLSHDAGDQSSAGYREFLEKGMLADILEALGRYGVEPFIASTKTMNRRLQRVDRIEETDDPRRDGQVRSLARGYAQGDTILQQESVAAYRLRRGRERSGE
jgi:molecular chaperone GrpE (heat shock protein)